MTKKLVALLLAAVMALSMTACGGSTTTTTAAATEAQTTAAAEETTAAGAEETTAAESTGLTTTKDSIIFAQASDVTTFDPHIDTLQASIRVAHNIFQTLWLLHDDGTYKPVLATEWEWTDDLHLNVTLREGVVFSNGNAFTAEDVIFTIQHGLEGAFPQYYSKLDMEATTCPDDYHINFVFTEVDPTFMFYMGNEGAGAILDKDTVEADPENIGTQPVGTGPYVLSNWTVGDSCVLTLNDKYYGTKPVITTLTYRVIKDDTQRANALISGEVDFAYDIASLDADSFTNNPSFTTYQYASDTITCLFFNSDEGHKMANENLRKALKSCIDKNSLASVATNGTGSTAWTPVLSTQSGFNTKYDNYDPYPQDFDAAKQYLADAGYADGVTLKVVFQDSTAWNNVYEALQNWCAQGGITLEAEKGDFATALSTALDRTGDWDIFILANGSASPAVTMSWFDKNIGAPFAQFVDEDFYAIMSAIYATTDVDVQTEKVMEAQDYIMEHVGVVPIYSGTGTQVYVSNLKGVDFWDNHCCELDMEYVYFE